jgi:serine/threonine-protein kinase RsbW
MALEKFQIIIPSEPAAGQSVQDRIMGILEARGFTDRDSFGVRLALEEALVNAMKHGNGLDPSKKVIVECEVEDHRVQIEVEDEGRGFDPGDVPDPTDEENLDKPSGRGLMLMRAFMTRIEYNSLGNRVLLEKVRDPE